MSKRKDPVSPPDFLVQAYAEELPTDIFLSIRLLFALRNSVQRVNADLARWLGSDALSPGRMQMLMILWAKKGPVLQRDLVDALGVSRASVSELVETLSRDELVKTRPDTQHGRRVYVELTPHGREVTTRQIRENGRRLDSALGDLTQDEKRDLIGRLDRLCPPGDG
ncbi:MarR family winged helix-turn-helix transcriptional regulator [Beijerinckia indica]|uniref:Transcriptional regulator, MarR family n=1 Tax=Beijerinckia indica subsp. indica (strain ATCC 9039 / DSM 1715 / NCIMB 8712) TaxID=395963 RepID=B2IKT9_BEII9|nr:MarR family winged helix-turn-helix transcriptional regulator [Beijerinckia indica]ACB95128.1 transcriptional regulator, MarR family [Beijerinckia indica subsp. indica ATCC 9039]